MIDGLVLTLPTARLDLKILKQGIKVLSGHKACAISVFKYKYPLVFVYVGGRLHCNHWLPYFTQHFHNNDYGLNIWRFTKL